MIGCTNLHQNMSIKVTHKYSELYPSKDLENYVASYFEARNESDKPEEITICPDAYFKLIIQVLDGNVLVPILFSEVVN